MHHWISHCWQVGRKAPPSPRWGKFFWLQIYPFQAILSNFGFCGRKDPPSGWGKIFWLWIYPFQVILSKFGFCGRKVPPLFCLLVRHSAHVAAHDITSQTDISCIIEYHIGDELAEKPTPPDEGNFLSSDLSISGNFEQLWFLWQKSPPPPDEGNFSDFGSIHFRWFWASLLFVAEKHPPARMRENFWLWLYPFQAILSKFGFCGWKAPLQDERKFFNFGSIHFRGFWTTLVFVVEKHPPPGWGKFFWLWIYPFQVILSKLCFCGRKAPPPPPGWGKLFDFWSIHFRWFWASLVLWQKPPPPRRRENFLTLDLSISGDLSKFGFCGRKPPPPQDEGKNLTLDLSISGDFDHLCFLWQKSPPPPQDEGKFFDFGSIHFRWFWGSLAFVAEKPPPPRMREIFWLWIYPFQVILSKFGFCGRKAPPQHEGKFFDFGSIYFRQFWATLLFVAEKPPPMRENFWLWIYPFQVILSKFGFCGRKAPLQDEGNFLTLDLSISGDFE